MKTSSCKAKGRRHQQWVRDKMIFYSCGDLTLDDVRSTSMGAGGEDILLSPLARSIYPYTFECKNVEKLNIWDAYKQAQYHADKVGYDAVVVFTRNHAKPLVTLDAEVFFKMCNLIYNSTPCWPSC